MKKNEKIIRRIFAIAAFVISVNTCVLVEHNRARSNDTTIQAACTVARLLPPPGRARNFVVEGSGTHVNRRYFITFDAPAAAIQTWLETSPGTSGVTPVSQPNGTLLYTITPERGGHSAEIILSPDRESVTLQTTWGLGG